jgi:teichuronic acid biosynthesis glycosyltransferase TuaH
MRGFAAVRDQPNVVSRAGRVPRPDIVRLIGAAEACLIPHVHDRLTEAMSSLKLYEYLAGGRSRGGGRSAADRGS